MTRRPQSISPFVPSHSMPSFCGFKGSYFPYCSFQRPLTTQGSKTAGRLQKSKRGWRLVRGSSGGWIIIAVIHIRWTTWIPTNHAGVISNWPFGIMNQSVTRQVERSLYPHIDGGDLPFLPPVPATDSSFMEGREPPDGRGAQRNKALQIVYWREISME